MSDYPIMNTTATALCGDPIFNVIVTFGTYVVSLGGIRSGGLGGRGRPLCNDQRRGQPFHLSVDSWHRRLSQRAEAS